MKYLSLALFIALLSGCASTSDTPESKDIALERSLPLEQNKPANIDAVSLAYSDKIKWEQFFQKSPTPSERNALLKEIKVADSDANATELLKLARKALSIGQIINAEAHLKLALRSDEHNPEVLLSLAEVSLRKNKPEEAFDYLSLARSEIEALPQKDATLVFHYRYILSLSHLATNEVEKAHAILSDLIRIDKSFVPAYVSLGQSYIERGKSDIAEFIVKRGIDRAKDTASLQNVLASAMRARGDLSSAKSHYEMALAIDPQHSATLINYAGLLVQLGNKESAEMVLKRAIAAAPGDYQSYLALAQCQRALAQYPNAKLSYERAIELNPESARARFGLAQLLHENLHQKSQALRLFSEVVQLKDEKHTAMAQAYINDILAKGL